MSKYFPIIQQIKIMLAMYLVRYFMGFESCVIFGFGVILFYISEIKINLK